VVELGAVDREMLAQVEEVGRKACCTAGDAHADGDAWRSG
jgi:hypothetical protein